MDPRIEKEFPELLPKHRKALGNLEEVVNGLEVTIEY